MYKQIGCLTSVYADTSNQTADSCDPFKHTQPRSIDCIHCPFLTDLDSILSGVPDCRPLREILRTADKLDFFWPGIIDVCASLANSCARTRPSRMQVMEQCLQFDPLQRPSIQEVVQALYAVKQSYCPPLRA
jgi:hypothetical protein